MLGSYCAVRLDEHEVFSAKYAVPDDFVALFEERDRKLGARDPEDADALAPVTYTASRSTILKRLDLLGFRAPLP